MFWHIKQDLISLFNRDKDNKDYLTSIDGFRSIANLSILFLHIITLFNAFLLPYPDQQWKAYLRSTVFALYNIFTLNLEIFFMLSGFLLTYKFFSQWNQNLPSVNLFLLKQYPISIIKRVLRFWPGLLLVTLISFWFGEPTYPSDGLILEFFRRFNIWIFCQNYVDLDYWKISFAPLWTISLDMQIHILLPLILYLFNSYKRIFSVYNSLVLLLIISILHGILRFDPIKMPIVQIVYRYPILSSLSSESNRYWIRKNYNVPFWLNSTEENPMKMFMHSIYLPLEARFGSFIIGAMVAIKLIENSNHKNNKSKSYKKEFFFGLIILQMLTSIQPSTLINPPNFLLIFFVATQRQFFTIGQAFILFTVLCPDSHPYHSPAIKRFLSSPIWIPISRLSYLVYLIHWRIAFELIFAGPLRFLQTYSITYAALISLPIILFITQFISCLWWILVEKPIERFLQVYFFKKHID